MSLLYKPVQNTVESKDGKKKWRPTLVKFNRVVDTRQVSQRLADLSAQSPGDVYNLLCNLGKVLGEYMQHSNSVHLENLGTFTLVAKTRGNGVDSAEKVSPYQINSLRVQFTPESTRNPGEGTTRAMLTGIRYERYGSQSALPAGEAGDTGGDEEEDDFIDPTT